MKRIDFENHFYDQSLIDALTARTEPPYYRRETDLITWSDSITMPQGILLKRLLDVDGGRLALMDQLGIDCAVPPAQSSWTQTRASGSAARPTTHSML